MRRQCALQVDGKENKDAAWYYATPKDAAKNIKVRLFIESSFAFQGLSPVLLHCVCIHAHGFANYTTGGQLLFCVGYRAIMLSGGASRCPERQGPSSGSRNDAAGKRYWRRVSVYFTTVAVPNSGVEDTFG